MSVLSQNVSVDEIGNLLKEKLGNFKVRKTVYPSKTDMNLMQRKRKVDIAPNMVVYGLFAAVVLLALSKVAIYNPIQEYKEREADLASIQQNLAIVEQKLLEYDEVYVEYMHHAYDYVNETEAALLNRVDVLSMLDVCMAGCGLGNSISIIGQDVNIVFGVNNFEAMAQSVEKLMKNEMVASVRADYAQKEKNSNEFGSISLVLKTAPEVEQARAEQ